MFRLVPAQGEVAGAAVMEVVVVMGMVVVTVVGVGRAKGMEAKGMVLGAICTFRPHARSSLRTNQIKG